MNQTILGTEHWRNMFFKPSELIWSLSTNNFESFLLKTIIYSHEPREVSFFNLTLLVNLKQGQDLSCALHLSTGILYYANSLQTSELRVFAHRWLPPNSYSCKTSQFLLVFVRIFPKRNLSSRTLYIIWAIGRDQRPQFHANQLFLQVCDSISQSSCSSPFLFLFFSFHFHSYSRPRPERRRVLLFLPSTRSYLQTRGFQVSFAVIVTVMAMATATAMATGLHIMVDTGHITYTEGIRTMGTTVRMGILGAVATRTLMMMTGLTISTYLEWGFWTALLSVSRFAKVGCH